MLILDKDDPERESEFELDFMLSLTMAQRYKMMSRLVRAGLRRKKKNESKKAPQLITRS